ncbi:MAG: polysaccharide deacetylase family protein [Paenibacillus sp.]|nr:polysaccharide deacetylase family protein [Paenibacillus sp.]
MKGNHVRLFGWACLLAVLMAGCSAKSGQSQAETAEPPAAAAPAPQEEIAALPPATLPETSPQPQSAAAMPEPVPDPQPALKPEPPASSPPAPKPPTVSVQKSQSLESKRLTLPQLRAKYPDAFKVSGNSKEKSIALTFDDGPDAVFTPQVLDVLKAHGVKATFFVLGVKAEAHPAIVKRMIQEGHIVGNHSYRHPLFTKLSVEQFAHEIEQTDRQLVSLIGYRPKLLRPPYGEINEEQLLWAKNHGYVVVNWNVDSLDWKNLSESQVLANVLGHTKAGSIILQHSAGGGSQDMSGTVRAIPGIIVKLKEQGYRLVTLPELLKVPKSK